MKHIRVKSIVILAAIAAIGVGTVIGGCSKSEEIPSGNTKEGGMMKGANRVQSGTTNTASSPQQSRG